MSLYRDPKEVMSEDDSQVYDKESKSYKSFYFHVRSLFTREGTVKPRKLINLGLKTVLIIRLTIC